MGKRLRRQWHAQGETATAARAVAAVLTAAVGWILPIELLARLLGRGSALYGPAAVAVSLLGISAVIRVANGSLRLGVSTDGDGLVEHRWLSRRRRVQWTDITAVERGESGAILHHAGGQVVLDRGLADWAQIAATAERHLPDAAKDDTRDLPAHAVASWLGTPLDGALVGRSGFHRLCPALCSAWGLLFVWSALLGHRALALTLALVGGALLIATSTCAVVMGGYHRYRRVYEVRATPQRIEARSSAGWRSYAWQGLEHLHRTGLFWVVTTTDGDLWLPPRLSNVDPLLHAIRQAIEARRQGWALPRAVGDVPESALSRAELRVETERGLSVTDQPGEGQGDG